MGSLGDGITEGEATVSDIRIAHSWRVRFQPRLLHDGRAANLGGAALRSAPARLFCAVDADGVIRLRRRAGDVEILLEHQAID